MESSADLSRVVETVVENVLRSVSLAQACKIPVGVSARHMHITQSHFEVLFGEGHRLTKIKELNQPGEFASEEKVTVVGPNQRTLSVRILGPCRNITQVEFSATDGVHLGMDLPHRLSGNIEGSAPLVLVGPEGVLRLPEGGIRAARHIHISPEDARLFGLQQGDRLSLRTMGEMSVTFNNVLVRVGDDLKLEMHLDTDEANAAGVTSGDVVECIGIRRE